MGTDSESKENVGAVDSDPGAIVPESKRVPGVQRPRVYRSKKHKKTKIFPQFSYAGYKWKDKKKLFDKIRRAQSREPTKKANTKKLIHAVETGDAVRLARQLKYGCRPTREGDGVKTLLMEAVELATGDGGEADKVVELLAEADPVLVNQSDKEGNFALDFVGEHNRAIAKVLVAAGAKNTKSRVSSSEGDDYGDDYDDDDESKRKTTEEANAESQLPAKTHATR